MTSVNFIIRRNDEQDYPIGEFSLAQIPRLGEYVTVRTSEFHQERGRVRSVCHDITPSHARVTVLIS